MKFNDFFKTLNNIIIGAVTVLFAMFIGFIEYICPKDYLVPMWVIYLIIIICYLLCIILYSIFSNQKNRDKNILPKVISITSNGKIILTSSSIYKTNMLVTIKYEDDTYFGPIAIGQVDCIQDDGKIVLSIIKKFEDGLRTKKIKLVNNSTTINKLKIEPYILYKDYLLLRSEF